MRRVILYIHGQGGNAEEEVHFRPLFPDCDVIGFNYAAQFPWEAKEEFSQFFDSIGGQHKNVTVVANSIGAFFAMHALADRPIEKAYFISPVVNMEELIENMMAWAHVCEEELREKGVMETEFGQTLSWEYLSYVRNHPLDWKAPTHILYGEKDNLTSLQTISGFAAQIHASLTVMEHGEHWFHTEEQMKFLDNWIQSVP